MDWYEWSERQRYIYVGSLVSILSIATGIVIPYLDYLAHSPF